VNKDEELARLEAAVYSRAGSTEAAVEFIDPVTGETVRATPSQLRLRALRTELAGQATPLDARNRFARVPDAADSQSLSMPALLPGPPRPRHRRFILPLVAVVAFAAGILTGLIVTSVLTPIAAPGAPVASASSDPLLIFDYPTRYPEIPVPDLGDQFVAESLRNISGTSPSEQGFGVYLGREARSGLYCLIVYPDEGVAASSCATENEVTQRGLSVRSEVTVRSPVSFGSALGDNDVKAALSTRGEFSLILSLTEQRPIDPPTTPGATLGTWIGEPGRNGEFQAELDAHGEGLYIALDCVGEGRVTVDLGSGSSSQFDCTSGSVRNFMNHEDVAHGAFEVTVFATGSVAWGLTIASTPVG